MLDEYMTMLGKFPEYSPRNVALIYTQAKDAQMVGTFKEWQARHDTFKLTKDDIMYDEEVAARVQESGREYEQKLSIKSGERGKVNLFKVNRSGSYREQMKPATCSNLKMEILSTSNTTQVS